MKKILYLMHVDWDWIKQRPHFIAEGLSKFYEIEVLCKSPIIRRSSHINKSKGLDIHRLFSIPFCHKKYVYPLNKLYLKLLFKFFIKKYEPDYVWIPLPTLYAYLPDKKNFKLIYDCMDDAAAFDLNDYYKETILNLEKRLLKESSVIFVSADNLADKLTRRCECADKMVLIRNAFDGNILKMNEKSKVKKGSENYYKIGYVGTISSWFDFEALEYVLKKFGNIEFHLIGPFNLPKSHYSFKNEKIKFYGPIEHEKLSSYIKSFDCMIMPFKVNELVKSVDPVKFYEYINYDKPIISVFYKELRRYSHYVDFYSNKDELVDLLDKMIKKGFQKKYSDEQRLEFLKNNSWNQRIFQIIKHLKSSEL